MDGSAWLKATVAVFVAAGVGVGWSAWTHGPEASSARSSAFPRSVSAARSDSSKTPTTSVSAATAGIPALGSGVVVSGRNLVDNAGQDVRLVGVDVSELTCKSKLGASTAPLSAASVEAIASWHLNAVRLGISEDCWLGINGVKPQYSGIYYQDRIKNWVTDLNAAGILVILELQLSAPGTILPHTAWPMPDEDHSPAFWSQVASAFSSNPGVIFDLFNEPYMGFSHPTLDEWSCWLSGCINTTPVGGTASATSNRLVTYQTAGMQQLVDVVRAAGAKQPILLGGLSGSGDPCGYRMPRSTTHGVCPEVQYLPSDPAHQLIIDLHVYLPNSACENTKCWNAEYAGISQAGLPLLTGEFGEKNCSAVFIDSYMNWADQHDVSYLAWAWAVNGSVSCVANVGRANHYLLQDWSGDPTTMSPDGAAFKAHVEEVYEEPFVREEHMRTLH